MAARKTQQQPQEKQHTGNARQQYKAAQGNNTAAASGKHSSKTKQGSNLFNSASRKPCKLGLCVVTADPAALQLLGWQQAWPQSRRHISTATDWFHTCLDSPELPALCHTPPGAGVVAQKSNLQSQHCPNMCMQGHLHSLLPAPPPTCPELHKRKVLVLVDVHIYHRLACKTKTSTQKLSARSVKPRQVARMCL